MILIAIFGLLQNGVYLLLYYRTLVTRNQTTRIFTMLAFTDLLISIFVAPLHTIQALDSTFASDCVVDALRIQSSAILISLSIYLVCLLSVDRFIHIRRLTNYRIPPSTLYFILFVFLLIACIVPMLRLIPSPTVHEFYSIFVILNGFLIIFTILFSYVTALRLYVQQSLRTNRHREHRMYRYIAIVLMVHIIFLLPILSYHFVSYSLEISPSSQAKFYTIAIIFIMMSVVVNPLLYHLTYQQLYTRILLLFRPDRHGPMAPVILIELQPIRSLSV